MSETIRVFDAFSGISAFHSAMDILGGFETIAFCENDPFAMKALKALYPQKGAIYYNDIRTIEENEIPDFDLLVGGFPCVAFSQAGRRGGFNDERGTLFFELARILKAKQPAFFCFENVPAILGFDNGEVFETILKEISELGYSCEWSVVDGSAYLPQARKRVFIVGYLNTRCAGEIFPLERQGSGTVSELTNHSSLGRRVYDSHQSAVTQPASTGGGHGGFYFVDYNPNSKFTDVARCITARQDSGMSKFCGEHSAVFFEYNGVYPILNPERIKVRQHGRRFKENGEPAFCCTTIDQHGIIHLGRIRRLIPLECWRLFGFTDKQFERAAAVLNNSDAKLYKLAGNSIMVPILVDILDRIKSVNDKYEILKGSST